MINTKKFILTTMSLLISAVGASGYAAWTDNTLAIQPSTAISCSSNSHLYLSQNNDNDTYPDSYLYLNSNFRLLGNVVYNFEAGQILRDSTTIRYTTPLANMIYKVDQAGQASALDNSTFWRASRAFPYNTPIRGIATTPNKVVFERPSDNDPNKNTVQIVYDYRYKYAIGFDGTSTSSYRYNQVPSMNHLGNNDTTLITTLPGSEGNRKRAWSNIGSYETCRNFVLHRCGDGHRDNQSYEFGTVGTEQCDGTDGLAPGQTCNSSCQIVTQNPPTCTLTPPQTVVLGHTSTLNWTISGTYTNTPNLTANPALSGFPYTVTTPQGSRTFNADTLGSHTISMTVNNAGGSTDCSTQVTVIRPLSCTLTMTPQQAVSGDLVRVAWNITGANFFGTHIYITPQVLGSWPYPINANQYSGSAVFTMPNDTLRTTTLTVTNNVDSYTCTGVMVAPIPPTCTLTPTSQTLAFGSTGTIAWAISGTYTNTPVITNIPGVTYLGGLPYTVSSRTGTLPFVGNITGTKTLSMTVSNGSLTNTCTAQVLVNQPIISSGLSCNLTLTPQQAVSGDLVRVAWNVTGTFFSTYLYVTPQVLGSWPYPINANQYSGSAVFIMPDNTSRIATLIVNNATQTYTCTGTVTSTINPDPTCSLTTSTPTITSGQTALLSGRYTNAIAATITPTIPGLLFAVPNRSDANIAVTPTTTTTYTLIVTGAAGTTPAICNQTITVNTSIVTGARLSLSKTLINDIPYRSGDNVSFRIDFANVGTSTVNNVVVSDYLPAALDLVSSQMYGVSPYISATGINSNNIRVEYSGFSLLPNQSGYIIITGRFKGYSRSNQTLNNAFLKSDQTPIQYAAALFNTYTPGANATITKTSDKASYTPNESARFTIAVTNNGPDTIENVQIIDTWPNSACITADSLWSSNTNLSMTSTTNPYRWQANAPLAVGQTIYLYLTGHIGANAQCAGSYTNTADLNYTINGQQRTAQSQAAFAVAPTPASTMSFEKRAISYGSAPGSAVQFELNYQNNGTATISSYDIVDYWPGTMTFVSASPSPTNQTVTSGGMFLQRTFTTPLAPGGSGKIIINGTIK